MKLDSHPKLSTTTLFLHWVVGITMIGLLASGIYMAENEVFALYPWHKSFGVLIATFVVLRVLWRIKNGWPTHVSDYSSIEKLLSRIVHYLLIIGTVLMPISGFMMSATGGHGVDFFGLELFARNPDPADPKEVIALNGTLAGTAHGIHEFSGIAILVAVILHVVGALKHHVMDKDGTLRRMLGAEV
jgi:cytochrome b561